MGEFDYAKFDGIKEELKAAVKEAIESNLRFISYRMDELAKRQEAMEAANVKEHGELYTKAGANAVDISALKAKVMNGTSSAEALKSSSDQAWRFLYDLVKIIIGAGITVLVALKWSGNL